jgi:FkbM family methyltransferase
MLIDLLQLREKYGIYPKAILHVGAHRAEEYPLYKSLGADTIYWVEANKSLAYDLKLAEHVCKNPSNKVFCEVVGERDEDTVTFHTSNNNQSSSILELGEHSSLFPDVVYTSAEKRQTKTISSILAEVESPKIDLLNLDIQGAELLALKGFKELASVQFIYTEINSREVYKGCALVDQIDEYLAPLGFIRAETVFWENHPWGDALYVRS